MQSFVEGTIALAKFFRKVSFSAFCETLGSRFYLRPAFFRSYLFEIKSYQFN